MLDTILGTQLEKYVAQWIEKLISPKYKRNEEQFFDYDI